MHNNLVIGFGEFLFDCFPDGRDRPGGAPANFALHAARCGAESVIVTACGADSRGEMLTGIAAGSGVKMVCNVVEYPTGWVKVSGTDNAPTYEIIRPNAWEHIRLNDEIVSLARNAAVFCFGSLCMNAPETRSTICAILGAEGKDIRYKVFDVNLRDDYGKASVGKGLELCNILKLNDYEFILLSMMFNLDSDSEEDTARRFMEVFEIETVIVTAGTRYSAVYTADGTKSVIPTPVVPEDEFVDAVAAGDAFLGAFVASLIDGKTILQAHGRAVSAAAEVCKFQGAGFVEP